jgi:hypothetical protein
MTPTLTSFAAPRGGEASLAPQGFPKVRAALREDRP